METEQKQTPEQHADGIACARAALPGVGHVFIDQFGRLAILVVDPQHQVDDAWIGLDRPAMAMAAPGVIEALPHIGCIEDHEKGAPATVNIVDGNIVAYVDFSGFKRISFPVSVAGFDAAPWI